ncbi:UGAT, partial [Symbiodinium microadriaticum]
MKLAVANYPRGEREVVLLTVQVGTESMSPLIWAVEKGALESAREILNDLLTLRADRARYYYGMEMLFTRHSDIISLLCTKAPSLLPTVFDGLIWRSKNVKNGMRRANYYIASLLRGEDGQLTDSLLDLIKQGDPEIICHPTVVFQADLLWIRLCCLPWALTKLWFCATLVVYVMAEQQAVTSSDPLSQERFTTIVCRAFLYIGSLGQLFAKHAYQTYRAVRQKQMTRLCCLPVPKYVLQTRQELTEVALMLCCEPVLHCLAVSSELLTNCCEHGEWQCNLIQTYNRLATFPMVLYFVLTSELVHLNVHLSVFSVICSCLMWEFMLYVAVLAFFAAAFASAIACLPQALAADSVHERDFSSWPLAFESLLSSAFNVYGSDNYEQIAVADEPMLKWFVMAFAACWHVYLMNLMVAQLCQRYNEIYQDARGNARLTRGINIYETSMPLISKKRWTAFVESLHLDEACELDEGDTGPRGAVPTNEDPYDYLQYPKVTLDRVQRYGGLANPALPWPSLDEAVDDSAVGKLTRMTQAKFEEMDRLMVDMAIKLQVRPPGTSGGTKDYSAMHSEKRDESKIADSVDGHEHDVGIVKETDVSEELALNEKTVNELGNEHTEDAETLTATPFDINPSENRSMKLRSLVSSTDREGVFADQGPASAWRCRGMESEGLPPKKPSLGVEDSDYSWLEERFTTIVCRAFLYIGSLGQLFAKHAYQTYRAVRQKQMTRLCCLPVPKYVLQTRQELTEVLLTLLLMCLLLGCSRLNFLGIQGGISEWFVGSHRLCCEPVLHCLAVSSELLTNCCEYGEWQCHLIRTYNRLAAFPMMLYFVLASELVHLNVSLSVFSVICSCLMWEFILYVAVLAFFTAAFASAVACLPPSLGTDSIQMRDFFSWPLAFESLLSSAFNVYGSDNYEQISVADEPMLKWIVMAFAACWHVYLMNLMVAQLCQRYNEIYHDARGNARLTRGINIYETSMPLISKKRWTAFVESLHLEEACELDEGDNGPRGAVPTTEDPYDYLQYPKVELDRVQRYGGLANPALPWPSLEEAVDDSAVGKLTRMTQAKFEEMDRLMVDMAIKLQVRPPGTSGGTKEYSAMHSEKRDESKMDGHEQDVGAAKETDISKELAELSEELPVNEATANELVQERTEEGEAMSATPYDVNGTSVVSGRVGVLLSSAVAISTLLFQSFEHEPLELKEVAEFEKKVAQTGASIVGLDMGGADADSLEKKAREQKRILFLLLQELMTSPLEKELLLDRPDVVMTDFATLAGCAVAQKLGIPLLVNLPGPISLLRVFLGMVDTTTAVNFLGLHIARQRLSPMSFAGWMNFDQMGEWAARFRTFVANGAVVLVQTVWGLDQPTPLPPNVVVTGPVLPPAHDLRQKLASEHPKLHDFLRKSGDAGVVYVTTGSLAKLHDFQVRAMYKGLKKANCRVVWSLKEAQQEFLPNKDDPEFYISKWTPQAELLQDDAVKVVITHCGWGGTLECMTAGKPVVAIPFFGDQPINAKLLVEAGVGELIGRIPMGGEGHGNPYKEGWVTEDTVCKAVTKVLQDKSYKKTA